MVETVKQVEAVPASYPATPDGLSIAATALDHNAVWQRIEAYIAHRWTVREVIWTVEGEGDWTPPLSPATITTAEKWESNTWVTVTLPDGPYGYCLPSDGPYRITANVGAGSVPAPVSEAFRRLAEYLAPGERHPGSASFKTGLASIDLEETRAPTWVAKAMQLSGAADLLRPYRRAQ